MRRASITLFIFFGLMIHSSDTALALKSESIALRKSAEAELSKFRRLDNSNPALALAEIDRALSQDPGNLNLQKFRWYLSIRTGETEAVLNSQQRDYELTRDLSIGALHLWCLFESEHMMKLRSMCDRIVGDHPGSTRAIFLRARFAWYSADHASGLKDIDWLLNRYNSLQMEQSPTKRLDGCPSLEELSGWRAFYSGLSGRMTLAKSLFKRDSDKCAKDLGWQLLYFKFVQRLPECEDITDQLLKAVATATPTSYEQRAFRLEILMTGPLSEVQAVREKVLEDAKQLAHSDAVPELFEILVQYLDYRDSSISGAPRSAAVMNTIAQKYSNWRCYFYQSAHQMYDLYDRKKARAFLKQSARLNSLQTSAWTRMTKLTENRREQLRLWDTAYLHNPRKAGTCNGRGSVYLSLKNYPEAIKDFCRCYELQPSQVDYLSTIASLRIRSEGRKRAIDSLNSEWEKRKDEPFVLLQQAHTLLALGEQKRAAEAAKLSTILFPETSHCWSVHATILDAMKRPSQAMTVCNEGFKRTRNPLILVTLAEIYLNNNETERAIAQIADVLKKDPACVEALILRGRANQKRALPAQALADFKTANSLRPYRTRAAAAILGVLDGTQVAFARKVVEEGAAWNPGNREDLRILLAAYLARVKKSQEALVLIDEMLEKDRLDRFRLTEIRVRSLIDLGRRSEAIEEYEIGMTARPTHSDWFTSLCELADSDKAKQLEQFFNAGIKQNSRSECRAFYWAYAHFLRKLGRQKDALAIVERYLKQDQDHSDFRQLRAMLLQETGDTREALAEVRWLCSKKPDEEGNWEAAMQLAEKAGLSKTEQRKIVDESLRFHPKSASLLEKSLDVHSYDPEHSIPIYSRLLQIQPGNLKRLLLRAQAYSQTGRHSQAIADLQSYCKFRPGDQQVRDQLLILMLRTGRYEEVLRATRRTLEKDPHDTGLRTRMLHALYLLGREEELKRRCEESTRLGYKVTPAEIRYQCLGHYDEGGILDYMSVWKDNRTNAYKEKTEILHRIKRTANIGERTELLVRLADFSAAAGKNKEAVAHLNEAITLSPADHKLYLKRASFYSAQGMSDKARQDREKAFALYKKSKGF